MSVFGRDFGLPNSLLSQRQFEHKVRCERIRASRRQIPFCLVSVVIEAKPGKSSSRKAAQLILRNLRVTDEKAMISAKEFSLLLVDTPASGGQAVIDRLATLFKENHLVVEMTLSVHKPAAMDDNSYFNGGTSFDEGNAFQSDDSFEASESFRARAAFDDERSDDESAFEAISKSKLDDSSNHADQSSQSNGGDWRDQTPVRSQVLATVGANEEQVSWIPNNEWKMSATASQDRRRRVSDMVAPDVDALTTGSVTSEDPFVRQTSRTSAFVKRTIDIVASLVGLIVIGPVILLAMAIIRWSSPGPAIFCQTREGFRGKAFTIYKLRTMVANAESSQQSLRELSHRDGPAFKLKHDPRVTRFGRFLRATCMDELPQLLNVLRGDMSLVGPRPLPWHESRACAHWQRRRLDVRPGLTCFWQVDKKNVETFDEWMRLDLHYVDTRNLWTDLVLIYRTFAVALFGRGGL